MATKNQIAHHLRIMKAIQIIQAKSHKQTCLENFRQQRVGMIAKAGKSQVLCGSSDFRSVF